MQEHLPDNTSATRSIGAADAAVSMSVQAQEGKVSMMGGDWQLETGAQSSLAEVLHILLLMCMLAVHAHAKASISRLLCMHMPGNP